MMPEENDLDTNEEDVSENLEEDKPKGVIVKSDKDKEVRESIFSKMRRAYQAWYKKHEDGILYTLDILLNAAVIVGLVIAIRYFLISPFQVSGSSMCNTLNYIEEECISAHKRGGEYIIIDKTYRFKDVQRGDVVVFKPPNDGEDYYVKRIVGLPNEKIVIKDGYVWIYNADYPSGWQLDETYLNEQNVGNTIPELEFDIPPDRYFVMGDNRNGSFDSRHWKDEEDEPTPFITRSDIDGKVWLVLWPFGNMRIMEHAVYEDQ